jgi:Flp pilus assembly protein TadG
MHTHSRKTKLQEQDGQAMVEFAFVVPLLLVLILGIFDFGRAINYWIDMTHMANDAARFAAVDHVPPTIGTVSCGTGGTALQACIREGANSAELRDGTGQVSTRVKVCITYSSDSVGEPIAVAVSAVYRWLPFLKMSAATVGLNGQATMRREAKPVNVTAGCAA